MDLKKIARQNPQRQTNQRKCAHSADIRRIVSGVEILTLLYFEIMNIPFPR
jgi:hypothetical protein